MSHNNSPIQFLKRSVVGIIGRERANRIAGPYHDWRARQRTERFLANLPESDLCVNLGCGYRPMKGWINVDRARGPEVQVVFFSEHLIEHVSKEDAARLLSECHRVLQNGGVLRLSTPDAELFLRSYADDRKFLAHPEFSQPIDTPVDRVNYMMREYGQHLWSYDEELLALMLKRTGFNKVVRKRSGVSLHPRMNNIDFEARRFESLYIEGVKEDK